LLRVSDDGSLNLRDLGSANGTLVNGRRLVGETALQPGDKLQLGPVILEVAVGDPLHDTICRLDETMEAPIAAQ
jgi:pSer/pThr/pTyr-binding forkhead associated (FHA) protein